MTPEERAQKERRLKELKLAKLKQQRAAMQQPEPEPEVAATDGRGITRALGQGAFMGWGDEITGGLVATAAKAGNLVGLNDDERPWGEIKDEVTGTERMEYDRYSKDNPIASLGTEIAGGLITDRFIPGGASRTSSRIRRLSQALGRNVGEGAVAGAGASDENRTQGALVGGGLGGMFGAALTGAGKIPALVSGRNVTTKLDDIAGNQRPIHLVTEPDAAGMEGVVGNFYRRGVGGAFGGRNRLAGQEAPFLEEAAKGLDRKFLRQQNIAADVKRTKENALDELQLRGGQERLNIADDVELKMRDLDDEAAKLQGQLELKPKLDIETENMTFRRQAAEAVAPERMDAATRAKLIEAEPQDANSILKGWWRKNGFDSVKKNNFKWNDGELTKTLKTVIDEDPGLKLKISNVPGMTNKMVKKLMNLKKGEVPTDISGEQLMAIRNVFAMASNNTSNKFDKGAMRTVANKFDDFIRDQLGPEDLAAFTDELARYGPAKTYSGAVDKAKNADGVFTPKDWLNALPSDQRVVGGGVLQKSAEQARKRAAQSAEKAGLAKTIASKEFKPKRAALRRAKAASMGGVAARNIKEGRKIRRAADNDPLKASSKAEWEAEKNYNKQLMSRAIPRGTSFPSQMVTTGALGTGPAALASGYSGTGGSIFNALLAGTGVARGLARPGVQRKVAGQEKWQRKLQIARKRYQDTPTKKNLKALRYAIQAATIRETQE